MEDLRLSDGTLFSMPINLDISGADVDRLSIKTGSRVVLRDPRDDAPLAIITSRSFSRYQMLTVINKKTI